MKSNKNRDKKNNGLVRVLDIFLKVSFVGFIAFIGYFIYCYTQLPELEVDNMMRPNDSFVYDRNNKYIGKISRKKENQVNITYNDLNQSLVNILVGTEDSTFFRHKGVDLINTFEGGVKSVLGAKKSGGGSSVTQQIIGWTHLDRNEKSYTRKVKEIILAFKVENDVDKEKIMEMYFNYFFYGKNNIHGVEKASEYFFDKSADELDVVQSALMVGTLNAPTTYNPLGTYDSTDKEYKNYSKERLDNVLLASHNQGYIGDTEYYLLQQVGVENTVKINDQTKSNQYSAYIDLVRREMEDKYKVDLTKTSTKIYTNMDTKAQNHADNITKGKVPGVKLPDKDMNFGFVLTRTQTGAITAVGGGKQYKKDGSMLLNNALDIRNQPGSAFKPIIDYSPTFEYLHWSDRAPISNAAMNYPNSNTPLRNVDGQSGGVLTMDKAIASSRNLTAIRAMEAVVNKIGFKGLNKYLTKLGFEFTDDELTYSYGIGGTNTGVSPVQMNGAFQAFGNGGKYIEPWAIKYYVNQDTNKKVVNPTKPVQAIDERTAFMTSATLERATKASNLVSAASYYQAPYAGKTGTSNWGKEGAQYGIPNLAQKDSWFSGYTDRYTLSVWSGFDTKGIKRGKYPLYGPQHDYAAYIWGSMMKKVTNGKEKSYLNKKPPKGIINNGNAFFYDDNVMPINIPIKKSDYSISVSGSGKNLVVNFDRIDRDGVEYYVNIGGKTYSGSGSYPIKEGQSFKAYYIYNGSKFGTQSGCIKKNKVTNKCS